MKNVFCGACLSSGQVPDSDTGPAFNCPSCGYIGALEIRDSVPSIRAALRINFKRCVNCKAAHQLFHRDTDTDTCATCRVAHVRDL